MRIHNFNAGPATLPQELLEQMQEEFLSWRGKGYSILEMGHRSDEFREILDDTQKDLSDLLNLPHHYRVLFLAGGATVQFAMIPMHFLGAGQTADYFKTGAWSEKAIHEAKKYGEVNIVASSKDKDYTFIPEPSDWSFSKNAQYCHYTSNETVHGVQFAQIPEVPSDVPLVSDMTSCLLSEPVETSKFGLIYAGAQKNLGIAGLSLVIIRDDLLTRNNSQVPSALHYLSQAQQDSLLNTPPTFGIYVMGLVAKWIKKQGGLQAMAQINRRKANTLYSVIDNGFYKNPVNPEYRSVMNPIFFLPNEELENLFLQEAEKALLYNLQGHRSVGGLRASLYNAVSEQSVDVLANFMKDFAKRHG